MNLPKKFELQRILVTLGVGGWGHGEYVRQNVKSHYGFFQ